MTLRVLSRLYRYPSLRGQQAYSFKHSHGLKSLAGSSFPSSVERPTLASSLGCSATSISRSISCSTALHHSSSVQLESNGKNLILKTNGERVLYHTAWLRHNCQCQSCLFHGERSCHPMDIDPSIMLKTAFISDGKLNLEWVNGHQGCIKLDWLEERGLGKKEDLTTPKTATELPVLSAIGLLEDKEKLWTWLHFLNEYGICLLTDFGTDLNSSRKLAIETMLFIQPCVMGEVTQVLGTSDDATYIGYSTNNLGFHMDQLYYESPPGIQLLHCIQFDNSVEGGENVMLDMFPVVEELREKHPQHFNTLTRVPASFEYIKDLSDNTKVDATFQSPHIQVDRFGKVVAMRWTSNFGGPLNAPQEDVEPYFEAHYCLAKMLDSSKLKFTHRLKPGEVMTFNNRRILHSRTGYKCNGGLRHLQCIYGNIDHFKNKYQILCKELGKTDVPIRRVFNSSPT